jgi:ATP-dependent exoDNAse (exonuclease V) alpha subunit
MAPDKTRIILTHTNDEVAALNSLARGKLRDGQELGLDVGIRVERGDRTFASGDRVMFLKNDRGLGIKNGSVGVVETVTAKDMTVRLDAGRSVAFDLKDYAHLDHGYAATIHKAQGVTVDRVHVLATPGLDRHAAYVALSRHRESVQLHYGRDDFADDARLARVLSRERAKDMASDYEREIGAPGSRKTESTKRETERAPEPERGRQQGIFSSFRPMAKAPESVVPAQGIDRNNVHTRQEAVRRYARSILAITRMEEQELPVLPHQRQAEERARAALDAIRPHAAPDMDSAFERDPALVREAADGRTKAAIRAMQAEAEIRNDPRLRADRFVARWQDLERQRMEFYRSGDWQAERSIKASMGAMGKSLERDAQMESILRNRTRELGIPMDLGRGVGPNIAEYLGLGRERGLSL